MQSFRKIGQHLYRHFTTVPPLNFAEPTTFKNLSSRGNFCVCFQHCCFPIQIWDTEKAFWIKDISVAKSQTLPFFGALLWIYLFQQLFDFFGGKVLLSRGVKIYKAGFNFEYALVQIRLIFEIEKWLWKSEFYYIWPSIPNHTRYL